MTTEQKIIKTKVGVLELGEATRQRFEGLSADGVQPR